MLLNLYQSIILHYILIFILSTALSPAWAAAGIGDWSQMWDRELDLIEVQLLFKQRDCGLTDELFHEVAGLAELNEVLPQQQFLARNIAEKPKDKRWFVIASGQKPNGGYDLSLEGLYPYAKHKELSLIWSEPQADHIYTQAVVSLCLLIELSAGDRLPILVVDYEGNKRHRFNAE